MSSKFDLQKHHRRSIRLPEYDYIVPIWGFTDRRVLRDHCRLASRMPVWGDGEWGDGVE